MEESTVILVSEFVSRPAAESALVSHEAVIHRVPEPVNLALAVCAGVFLVAHFLYWRRIRRFRFQIGSPK